MVQYRYLEQRGAVGEAAGAPAPATVPRAYRAIPRHILELMPQAVARENLVLPLSLDGETLTCAAVRADDLGLADKLTFILNKKIRLVSAGRPAMIAAINYHYCHGESESVDSFIQVLTDTVIDSSKTVSAT